MEWIKANIIAILMCAQFVIGGTFWVSSMANSGATATAAMVTINTRLDRIYEKLDGLPVLAEKVREDHDTIVSARGDYANLEVRLRAIETNVAAVHLEAVDPKKREKN